MLAAGARDRAWAFAILTRCGGRRVVLAAVQNPLALERILRHVGLWPDSEFGVGIDAIRGPPEDIWPAELDPSADMAAVDDELPTDWAA